MWYWYLRAQELANERHAEARQSRLGGIARAARARQRSVTRSVTTRPGRRAESLDT
jgi:hypothetical protein